MGDVIVKSEDIVRLIRDVAQIKRILEAQSEEVELTTWADEELRNARNREKKISNEEAKKMLFEK